MVNIDLSLNANTDCKNFGTAKIMDMFLMFIDLCLM